MKNILNHQHPTIGIITANDTHDAKADDSIYIIELIKKAVYFGEVTPLDVYFI
ncbi:MAG: hypothetical protein KAH77_01130 [Thiomargarita sp.]|nr:hypothetical protein [Thiomargarita sp.]